MAYKKVVIYCCDACGKGSQLVNTIFDDSFRGTKDFLVSCGWKVRVSCDYQPSKGDKFLCDKCIEKGKTFDDCIGYDIK